MLSPEQFAELIVMIETNHDDGPKPEVRRAQRISHPCRITITLGTSENAGPARKVQMKDISARGMCFLYEENLPPGTDFLVKLESPEGKCVSILSHVVHCRQLDAKTFQIGSEFTCTLGHKEEAAYTPRQTAEDLMRIRSSILG